MMTTLAWVILPIEKRPFLRLRARVQQTGSRCSMQSALADCTNLAADRALTRNAAQAAGRDNGPQGMRRVAGRSRNRLSLPQFMGSKQLCKICRPECHRLVKTWGVLCYRIAQ